MAKKAVAEDSLFGIGLISGAIGYATLALTQDYTKYGIFFLGMGACCIAEHLSHRSRFDVIFRAIELSSGIAYPIYKRKTKKKGHTLWEFTLPAGLSTQDIEDNKERIEQYLGRKIEISYGFKNFFIKVYPKNEQTKYFYEPTPVTKDTQLALGYDRDQEMTLIDMDEGEPHLLVGGEAGSGKSSALRAILLNLIFFNDVELFLIDLKNGVEFGLFKDCTKVIEFGKTEAEAIAILKKVDKEVDRRYWLFQQNAVTNISEYNEICTPLKYQYLFIDEFATLMYNDQSIDILETLSAKSRAAGIFLILATQRPDAKVITGRIKANFSNIYGLKTLDATNSQIIIGHKGLESLRGRGHGILKKGSTETFIQSPFIEPKDVKKMIKPYTTVKGKDDIKQIEEPKQIIQDFDFMEDGYDSREGYGSN